ncbi:hypothetical protein F5Y17DRAFT_430356 [Xylariaceae sp. FL0594]|nr:hypothetical protein F5Y17DRAFT_430356 [Xylariaceae sp. FL0594]
MDKRRNIQLEVSNLVNLLSLILNSGLGLGGDSRGSSSHLDPPATKFDESEFERPLAPVDADAFDIRRRTLDRLAEMLARFKDNPGSKSRGSKSRNKNLAAKHVTSVTMVEDLTTKTLTIYCAKNSGLDVADGRFLEKLEIWLREVAASVETADESSQTHYLDQVFTLISGHQQPRVSCYTAILREELGAEIEQTTTVPAPLQLTTENVRRCDEVGPSNWKDNNGLLFRFDHDRGKERPESDEDIVCLSDRNDENIPVHGICQQIISELSSFLAERSRDCLKALLEKIHRIILSPRHRPVLKSLLRRTVRGDGRSFDKAWDALLYLTRIFDAAVVLLDFAKSSGAMQVRLRPISAAAFKPFNPPTNSIKGAIESLKSIGYTSVTPPWQNFFRSRTETFTRQQQQAKTVHGEVQAILHFEELQHTGSTKGTIQVFPYIGCSKKCCFFCEIFREVHGVFEARGTHHTLFPRWTLPITVPPQSLEVLRRFSDFLKRFLSRLLSLPHPPRQKELLRQSSAALSTAQATRRNPAIYTTRPQSMTKMIMPFGFSAAEHTMDFRPLLESPGYAEVIGGTRKIKSSGTIELPIEKAELMKINHARKVSMLEDIDEMPSENQCNGSKKCRRCADKAAYRCSSCRTYYCSKACQKRDWVNHIFVCRIPKRPNDVDFLNFTIRKSKREMNSEEVERRYNGRLYLLADDHICRTFGFNNCKTDLELINLVCLYSTVLSRDKPTIPTLQQALERGLLRHVLEIFCELERQAAETTGKEEYPCVTWFLTRCSSNEPFTILPNMEDDPYELCVHAVSHAIDHLQLPEEFGNGWVLDEWQADVFHLYVAIQPYARRLPDVHSSLWMKFGFCYCRTFEQRVQLARGYWQLLEFASYDEIVSAYKTATLADLMSSHGLGMREFRPYHLRPHEANVYKLMIGVEHALSGRFCACFRFKQGRACHEYFETHLDAAADTNFGFHLTNSWERWQLLNFYKHIFTLPGFDPVEMAKAKADPNTKQLEKYLETLVPNAREKLIGRYRCNILFPRLDGRQELRTEDGRIIRDWHIRCRCKIHDVSRPPGLANCSLGWGMTELLYTSAVAHTAGTSRMTYICPDGAAVED